MTGARCDQLWFTIAELTAARIPSLSARQLKRLAPQWRASQPDKVRKRAGRGGGFEFHISLLPAAAQARMSRRPDPADATAPARKSANDDRSRALWARYESLSKKQKDECARRLKALKRVEALSQAGLTDSAAVAVAAGEEKIAAGTVWRWLAMVKSERRGDWLAALAPAYRATKTFSPCDERAWNALLTDYLRSEKPGFSACYRRMKKAAAKEGWSPIPSERALRRRLDAEAPRAARVVAREGRDAAKALYPAQRRSRAGLHAMSAVNFDGHKFDVFVRFEDGRIGRPFLIAIQDVYSGKILSWRYAESENRIAVRLAIGDMVERFGIPDAAYLDNGRAFASKWITGGAANRFRFKIRDEDPNGLLVSLGVDIHWTTPYAGQSKPIERAFRDLCEDVAKHPFCAGAYTGNRPDAKPENYGDRAIPFEEFKAFANEQIADHNAREGRRTETAAGRSFDHAFAKSMESAIVRWASPAQRRLWLLAAERVTARKPSGEIHLFNNRYWSPALNEWTGKKVTVRFDPDNLAAPALVYGPDDALIAEAQCIDDAGFASAEDAKSHAKARSDYLKSVKRTDALRDRMRVDDLADLYTDKKPGGPRETPTPQKPAVQRLAVGWHGPAGEAGGDDMDQAEFEAAFGRGLRLVSEE